jgi:hypothetical protein
MANAKKAFAKICDSINDTFTFSADLFKKEDFEKLSKMIALKK